MSTAGPDTHLDEFLDLLKQMVRYPSVVGAEQPFFRAIQRELEEIGVKVTLYEGLLLAEGSQPDSGYISVHSDRHGLICTGPNEFQYAAFVARNRGDLLGDSVSEKTYNTLAGRFHNQPIQAYNALSGVYLGKGEIVDAYLCERRGNIIFNVANLDHLLPGTPVAYMDRLTIHDGLISAQLDNVLMVSMLIHLYRCGYQGTGFFTAQEEAGRSWRFLLEWFRRVNRVTTHLLVLDTSPYPDREAADAQQVTLRSRDAHAKFDPNMVDWVKAACRMHGIKYTFKDRRVMKLNAELEAQHKAPLSLGTTEMGRLIVASEGEVQGTTLQIPTTGYHTPAETARLSSVDAAIRLLFELCLVEPAPVGD